MNASAQPRFAEQYGKLNSSRKSSGSRRFFEVFETMIGATVPLHLRTMVMEERIARQIDASVIFSVGNFTFAVVLAVAFSPYLHPLFVWPWCALPVLIRFIARGCTALGCPVGHRAVMRTAYHYLCRSRCRRRRRVKQ